MTNPSHDSAAAFAAVPRLPALYGVSGALAVLAALTLLRALYLGIYPFDLHADEAQYWVWAQDLAFGYYSKPPMVAWLIAATSAVCGDGEACVRLSSPILHLLTALAVYGIGRRLYDARIGFWSALVYATLPGVSFSSVVVSTDVPLLLFWAVALYAYVRALRAGTWRWWLVVGVAIGLGLLGKYAMIFFVLSAIIHALLERKRIQAEGGTPWPVGKALVALILGFVIYSPNLLWNAGHSFVSYAHTGDNANLSGELFRFDSFFEFFGSQFGVFGPALFAALLLLVARARGLLADGRLRLLAAFTLPTLAIMLVQAFLSRANANWAAPAYVAASVMVTAWALQGGVLRAGASLWRGRALVATGSVVLHTGLIAVFMVFLAASHGRPDALPGNADPFKRLRGWHELGVAVAHVRNEFMPGAPLLVDERKLLAEVLYYVRPYPVEDTYKWRPTARINDHFDLTRPFTADGPDRVLYVTARDNPRDVISRFARADLAAEIRTPIGRGRERVVRIYELEGFQGYPPAR